MASIVDGESIIVSRPELFFGKAIKSQSESAPPKKVFHYTKCTCSEYVYEAFKRAGIYLKYERDDFISPSAFWSNSEIEMKMRIQ